MDELNVFSKSDPKPQEMVALMSSFNVSPESFTRLTNILPKDFQLKNLFCRLSHQIGTDIPIR
jgi:hypothetical protein